MTAGAKPTFLKVLVPVLVILTLAVGGLTLLKSHLRKSGPSVADTIREGGVAPSFELARLGGGKTALSELKGKVFLINFWATWCEACIVEMPSIVQLWKSFREKGLEVISVSVDEKPEGVVPPFAKKLGMEFPLYVDEGTQLSNLFDVRAIPITVIIDRHRNVLLIESGERDWNSREVRDQMEKWLSER